MTVDPARWAVLTVDLGTGGPKTSLVTLDGTIHFSEFTAVETERPSPGRALQDAEEWWRQILASARRGLDGGAVRRESVRAVAVTGQWSSVVPTRADLSPAGPCRMWLDTSASRHSQRIVGGPVLGYDPRASRHLAAGTRSVTCSASSTMSPASLPAPPTISSRWTISPRASPVGSMPRLPRCAGRGSSTSATTGRHTLRNWCHAPELTRGSCRP